MEPVKFHTRSAVGLGTPTNTTGTVRPLMLNDRPIHTVHYTGIRPDQIFFSSGDGIFDTIDQAFSYLRRVEEVARRAGKPFEYNTIIPVMSDNSSHVIAYADEFTAAHSLGENSISHGTQFSTGVNQELNDGAILAFQWWNAILKATGRLSQNSSITPHQQMPGASTACPGPTIMRRLPELRTPYQAPTPPPVVNPQPPSNAKDELMITIFQPSDCLAEFIGMVDKNGNALEIEWISSAADQRRRNAHIAAGAQVDTGPATKGRFVNCVLSSNIPTGDVYNWTAADFHKVRP